jgi:hypothetical protein
MRQNFQAHPRKAHRHPPGHERSSVGGPHDVVAGALAWTSARALPWTLRHYWTTTTTGRSVGRPHNGQRTHPAGRRHQRGSR